MVDEMRVTATTSTTRWSWSCTAQGDSDAARQFEATVRQPAGATAAVVDLHGEINATAEARLNAAYAEVESFNPSTIVLNFSGVRYINSTGIALIVGCWPGAQGKTPPARSGLSPHYLEIFQITRLADFMRIYPDESAALADTGSNPIPKEPRTRNRSNWPSGPQNHHQDGRSSTSRATSPARPRAS